MLSLMLIALAASCIPQTKETQCKKNEAFDSARRKCVPVLGAASTNTVLITSKSPAQSYTTNINSGSVTHSISVSDSYNYGFTTVWKVSFVNNSTVINNVTVSTNTLDYTFNPNALYGVGSYVLEAIVLNQAGNTQLNSRSWNITVSSLAIPTLINPTPAGTAASYNTNITSATHTLFINNPDNQSGNYIWRVDGSTVNSGTFTGSTTNLNYTLNPSLLSLGLHTITLELNNGASSVYSNYLWTIAIIEPNLPTVVSTTPSHLTGISVVDGENLVLGGYLDPTNAPYNQFCVDVNNFDLNGDTISDIDIRWEINSVTVNSGTFAANQYCVTSLPAINLINPTIGESKELKAIIYKAGTTTIVDYRAWSLSVRPKNIRPQLTISSANTSAALGCNPVGGGSTNVNYTGCTMTQSTPAFDNSRFFAFDLVDPDIGNPITNDTAYSVVFRLQNQDLDGVSNTLSASNCTYALGAALGSAKLRCQLSMDAFGTNGPLPAGNYTLKAYVIDNGSPWTATSEQSNEVSWEVAVTEFQSSNSIAIAPQTVLAIPPANLSYVELSDNSCATTNNVVSNVTSANNAVENGWIKINTFVRDEERDDFSITIEMANGNPAFPGSFITVAPTQNITRVDDIEFYHVQSCVQVPEWAVWNQADGVVDLRVTVTDAPTNPLLTQYSDIEIFQIFVENNNPAPGFADNSTLTLGGGTWIDVFAGFPLLITAPSFSDASTIDGNNVEFKWQVQVNGGGWADIPNANSSNQSTAQLVWTPSPFMNPAGDNIELRLCLGDDGFGNNLAACVESKTYDGITAYPSVVQVTATDNLDASFKAHSSGNNLATWYDATNENLYVAYSSGIEVIVEKKRLDTGTGAFETAHSIRFDSEEPTKVSVAPTNISMTGIDGASLFIAYKVASSPSAVPQMRVRRIDLTNDKLGFHYVGLYNAVDTGNDLVANEFNLPTAIFSQSGNNGVNINFTGQPANGDNFEINGVNFVYGPGNDFCTSTPSTVDCPDTTAVATNLAQAINDSTSNEIAEVLSASAAGTTTTIIGPHISDYYDEINRITPVVGQIRVQGTNWYLPYANATSSLAIGIMHGNNANQNMTLSSVSHTNTTSNTFNQSIANEFDSSGNMIMVTKNSSGNADVYRFNVPGFTIAQNINSLFNLTGFDHVDNLSLSIGAGSTDGFAYIAGISFDASNNSYLNAGIIDIANFANRTARSSFTTVNPLVADIDEVKIAADPVTPGRATIALTTEGVATHLGRLTFNTASWTNSIAFNNYDSPKLNDNDTVLGAKIAITPIFNLTKGASNEASVTGIPDNNKNVLFFSFHENDSGNNVIKSGMFNVTPTTITTDSDGVIGSYPTNLAP